MTSAGALDVASGAIGIADAGKLADTTQITVTPISASFMMSSSKRVLGALRTTSRARMARFPGSERESAKRAPTPTNSSGISIGLCCELRERFLG